MKIRDRIKSFRRVKASDLAPNPRNWREHSTAQADAMRGILAEVGYAGAALARETKDGLQLIDGHLRAELNPEEKIPVLILDVTEAEANKILATFDPIGSMADTNAESLAALLAEIDTESEALESMLGELAAENGIESEHEEPVDAEPQIDRAAELQKEWKTELGQLWIIEGKAGEHRVLCGDSTKREDVERVMGGSGYDLLLYDPEWDDMPTGMNCESVLAFCDCSNLSKVVELFGHPAWCFVWDCVTSWYTPNRPLRRAKLCLWFGDLTSFEFDGAHYGDAGTQREVKNTRGSYTFTPNPKGKHLSDVFSLPITSLHSGGLHNHSKPVDWVRMLIGDCSTGNIFDPFVGSGTSLIVAEQLERRCFGIEISPSFVAVILQRAKDCGMSSHKESE